MRRATGWCGLAAAAAALGGCAAMTVDSRIVSQLDTGDAWMELRTVRDAMELSSDVNDSLELWGVNRTHESVCARASFGLSPHYWLLAPGQTQRLIGLGKAVEGEGNIAVSPDGQTCDGSLFD